MNQDVTTAVLRLQDGLLSGRLQHWRAERAEEALDRLLSRPDRIGDPFHLQRNAMSDARKKLLRRGTLMAEHAAEIDVMADANVPTGSADTGVDMLRVDVLDTVRRTGSAADRTILAIALDGGGAGDVAEALGISYDVAKVRLSRARQRARRTWDVA